jgi:hypothetical protein
MYRLTPPSVGGTPVCLTGGFATVEQFGADLLKRSPLEHLEASSRQLAVPYALAHGVHALVVVRDLEVAAEVARLAEQVRTRLEHTLKGFGTDAPAPGQCAFLLLSEAGKEGYVIDVEATTEAWRRWPLPEQPGPVYTNHLASTVHGRIQAQLAGLEPAQRPFLPSRWAVDERTYTAVREAGNKARYLEALPREAGGMVPTALVSTAELEACTTFEELLQRVRQRWTGGEPRSLEALVLKANASGGGYFQAVVDSTRFAEARAHLIRPNSKTTHYLVQPYLKSDPGDAARCIGATIVISPSGECQLYSIAVQRYRDHNRSQYGGSAYDLDLESRVARTLWPALEARGKLLAGLGVVGPMGLDFLRESVDAPYLSLVDPNARLPGSAVAVTTLRLLRRAGLQARRVLNVGIGGNVTTSALEELLETLRREELLCTPAHPRGVYLQPTLSGTDRFDLFLVDVTDREADEMIDRLVGLGALPNAMRLLG